MSEKELYDLAYSKINKIELSNNGTAGHVACALETINGNIYTGVCIDIPCSIGMCAEQSAIAEMINNNKTQIKSLIAVYENGSILPPCGKCREFIYQVNNKNLDTIILLPELTSITLKELLPERWDYLWN